MTKKQILNAFIKGTNNVDYGVELYQQLTNGLDNPLNDYNDYERDINNIKELIVGEVEENNMVHFTIVRTNGNKCFVETCI